MSIAVKFKLFKIVATVCVLWSFSSMPTLAESTSIKIGVNQNMQAQLMSPDGAGPYPAILLLHTSGGLQSSDVEYARRLVAEGYVVLVPAFLDAYGISAKTRQLTFTTSAQPIYDDFLAALEQLRRNKKVNGSKLGAIGFSNGGYFALWLAATGKVQAGVSYYGAINGAGTDKELRRFHQTFSKSSSPVLVLHGTNDSTVRIEIANKLDAILTAAGASHSFYPYENAEHRFERDGGGGNEIAAADAWQRTKDFLK